MARHIPAIESDGFQYKLQQIHVNRQRKNLYCTDAGLQRDVDRV